MILIIGGFAQGKLDVAKELLKERKYVVIDGADCEALMMKKEDKDEESVIVVDHLHCYIKEKMKQGVDVKKEIFGLVEQAPESIFICDEIGNGIVPMEAFERDYREATGRILIELAKEAEEVIRVSCGIGQKIK